MIKTPFTRKNERSNELLDLIHAEVCGLIPICAIDEGYIYIYIYFITFTNDHSRYGYVHLMKYKPESFWRFKEFRNQVKKKQTGKSIKMFWSNQCGEYLS